MNGLLTLLRVTCTFTGLVVVLMALAGCLGLADFRLIFVAPEGRLGDCTKDTDFSPQRRTP